MEQAGSCFFVRNRNTVAVQLSSIDAFDLTKGRRDLEVNFVCCISTDSSVVKGVFTSPSHLQSLPLRQH